MKRLIIFLLLCMPLVVSAQNESLTKVYDAYLNKQGYTTVELSRDMLKSMGVKDGINRMVAISTEEEALVPQFCQDVEQHLTHLKQLFAVTKDGRTVRILTRSDENDKVEYMAIFTRSEQNAVLITLEGNDIKIDTAMSMLGGKK